MRRILILGGTRFFGKRLVERLLEDSKNEVTILTRGETSDPLAISFTGYRWIGLNRRPSLKH